MERIGLTEENLKKSFKEFDLEKGKSYPEGTTREWNGKKFIKQSGKWVPVKSEGGKSKVTGDTEIKVGSAFTINQDIYYSDKSGMTSGPSEKDQKPYFKKGEKVKSTEEGFFEEVYFKGENGQESGLNPSWVN